MNIKKHYKTTFPTGASFHTSQQMIDFASDCCNIENNNLQSEVDRLELPTDKQISSKALSLYETSYAKSVFETGAKWMRELLKNK